MGADNAIEDESDPAAPDSQPPPSASPEDDAAGVSPRHARSLLTGLHIGNFKCYSAPDALEVAHVPFSKLTLLYGVNSAGKSTILQALLVLAQTLNQAPLPGAAWPRIVLDGPLARLGTFTDVVHRHRAEDAITLGVSWLNTQDYRRRLDYSFSGENGDLVRAELWLDEVDEDFSDLPNAVFERAPLVEQRVGDRAFLLGTGESSEAIVDLLRPYVPDENKNDIEPPEPAARPVVSLVGLRIAYLYGWWTEDGRLLPVSPIVIEASSRCFDALLVDLDSVVGGVRHLGPARAMPHREPVRVSEEVVGVGTGGEAVLRLLTSKLEGQETVRRVNTVLSKRFKLPYRLAPVWYRRERRRRRSDAGNDEPRIANVLLERDGLTVSLASVGFGIVHLLPIIVESVRSNNRPLLIEQPETHLDPDLGVDLADYLVNTCNGVEYSDAQPQIVVETHSENILIRLTTLVAGNPQLAEVVRIIDIDPAGPNEPPLIVSQRWDDHGDLDPGIKRFENSRRRAWGEEIDDAG